MSVRKIKNSWWVDLRFERLRYRKKSPDNTKAGAQAYEAVLRQRLARGQSVNEENKQAPSFEQFSDEWLKTYVISNNKPSEQRQKRLILNAHLNPAFGRLPLDKISNQKIEEYKAKKIKSGLANKTINNQLAVLSGCLRKAHSWGKTKVMPEIKLLKLPPREFDFLNQEECEQLLCHATGLWYQMIFTALKTGLRLGELTALRWKDIDFKNQTITVRLSFVRDQVVSPKSNKIRQIKMTKDLYSLLSGFKSARELVFGDTNGEHLKPERCRRELIRICDRARLRKTNWHTLRHTFASHLSMAGASMPTIQKLLGHSDIKTTMIYAHLSPTALKDAIDLLEPTGVTIDFGHHLGNRTKNVNNEINDDQNLNAKVKQKQDDNPV